MPKELQEKVVLPFSNDGSDDTHMQLDADFSMKKECFLAHMLLQNIFNLLCLWKLCWQPFLNLACIFFIIFSFKSGHIWPEKWHVCFENSLHTHNNYASFAILVYTIFCNMKSRLTCKSHKWPKSGPWGGNSHKESNLIFFFKPNSNPNWNHL